MIKGRADDLLIFGITDDNIRNLIAGSPIYVDGAEIEIDVDFQIIFGQKAIGINGRKCLIQSLTPAMIEDLKKGHYKKIPKNEHSRYDVLIFYGKTNEDCIRIVNAAKGGNPIPLDLRPGEAIYERVVDGQPIQERGSIPLSVLRDGGVLPRM